MTALYHGYTSLLLSFLVGFFLLHIIFAKKEELSIGLHCFLGAGLGMGISGLIGFISLLIFGQYQGLFVLLVHLGSLFLLAGIAELKIKIPIKDIFYLSSWKWMKLIPFVLMILLSIPLWDHSHFYLFGGWDAWQTWNLKASFIALSGTDWTNMLHPGLWRSSPHYPLLLPLINVWGYFFHGDVYLVTNVLTSFMFSFLTIGLLMYGLMFITRNNYSVFLMVALLTMARFVKLSLSQYADILLGYYLLGAILALILAKKNQSLRWTIVAGLFLGLLSFTKSEGMAAAFLVGLFALPYLLWRNPQWKKLLLYFGGGVLATGIWTVIFKFGYATENMSFINGFVSEESPTTLRRFVVILYFYWRAFVSHHYSGLWIVLTMGLIMSKGRCFNKYLWIIPVVLFIYFGIITVYYAMNTYFPIEWWLQVSLHRIIFALIPLACFWAFISLWQEEKN